jgi:hypothetical protein
MLIPMDDSEGVDLAASGSGKTLCGRCRLLDLEKNWLGYADTEPEEHITVVPVDSIRSDCALCVSRSSSDFARSKTIQDLVKHGQGKR